MMGIFRIQRFGKFFPGIVIAFLALQKVHGEGLYLAIVGPPPLRFEAPAANDPVFIKELTLPKPDETAATLTVLPPDSEAKPPAGGATNNVSTAAGSGGLGGAAKNAPGKVHPASNLLSTMPRMMTDYLRPIRGGGAGDDSSEFQPGDTIFVPTELGFVPPMPGHSRAIYQSR
jgi:hypothetical protein